MKSINEVGQEDLSDQHVTAAALKEMTLSPEELHEIAVENICNSIMSSMVSVATKNGAHFYGAKILTSMRDDLLKDITDHFEGLGYSIQMGAPETDKTGQEFKLMVLSWKDA